MKIWRYIPLETNNGYRNMALDEAILRAVILKKSPFTFRFYKWEPSTATIGRNQSLADEINVEFCKKRGFDYVRRITGGGAVFHDNKGEITYSIVCSLKFLEKHDARKVLEQFELITQGIVEGLNIFGLESEKGIIHCPALFMDGKKFSGNAQVRRKGYLLQHGTILLTIDPNLMYTVLKTPPNVSKSRMVRSVKSKCIGIREKLENYDEDKFVESIQRGFERILNIKLEIGDYSAFELKLAHKLMKEKYSQESWLCKYE
jgi:lipoate-protein ligase A